MPDKQQYNNAKLFSVYVLVEEVENYYEFFKYARCMNLEPQVAS